MVALCPHGASSQTSADSRDLEFPAFTYFERMLWFLFPCLSSHLLSKLFLSLSLYFLFSLFYPSDFSSRLVHWTASCTVSLREKGSSNCRTQQQGQSVIRTRIFSHWLSRSCKSVRDLRTLELVSRRFFRIFQTTLVQCLVATRRRVWDVEYKLLEIIVPAFAVNFGFGTVEKSVKRSLKQRQRDRNSVTFCLTIVNNFDSVRCRSIFFFTALEQFFLAFIESRVFQNTQTNF